MNYKPKLACFLVGLFAAACDFSVPETLSSTPADPPQVPTACGAGAGALPVVQSPPELPRERVDTRYVPPAGGTTYQVRQDCSGFTDCFTDLQTAIDAAQLGDILELEAGATFTGHFVLPNKPGKGKAQPVPRKSDSCPVSFIRRSSPWVHLPPPSHRRWPHPSFAAPVCHQSKPWHCPWERPSPEYAPAAE